MADEFSLNDILAEIDAKRAKRENNGNPADVSVTSIIGGEDELDKVLRSIKHEESAAETKGETNAEVKPVVEQKAEAKPAVEQKAEVKPVVEQKAEVKPVVEQKAEAKPTVEPKAEIKPAVEPKAEVKPTVEQKAEVKPKVEPKAEVKPVFEQKAEVKPKVEPKAEVKPAVEPKKAEKKDKTAPIPSKKDKTGTIPILKQEKPVDPKVIERRLEAEERFDDPEELIDSINPYEMKSKASDMESVLSGDTKGLGGNELKKMAEQGKAGGQESEEVKLYTASSREKANNGGDGSEQVKEYVPQKEKETTAEAELSTRKMSEKERRSNEALLEKLNSSIIHKRDEEEVKRRTLGITTEQGEVKSPTQGLNIDYGGKVIRPTGMLPDDNELLEAQMRSKSRRKLRDFVMDEDEEEEEEEENFENYDSTGQIWSDLCESHKTIWIRLIILLIMTLFMTFVAIMGDLGKGMTFDLFGTDVTFLDRRDDAQGFVFYNLIMGVGAAAICSSVMLGGFSKLFKLKADCDTVCAVPMLISIITAAVNIQCADDLLLSRSYIFIPVAIAGLMFNTLGKLIMITRAKRNFRFISGDGARYSAVIAEDEAASALTKGLVSEVPFLAAMRKTELLTDFLKNSYCEDKADRVSSKLVPISIAVSLLTALLCFFVPYDNEGFRQNIYWTLTVFTSILTAAAPFSTMFMVNYPLTRAGRGLLKTNSAVLGYQAAEDFSKVNAVMVDASSLFPAGTVIYSNIKHYKQTGSFNNIALDQAIILAASLAIKSGSMMSEMFRDMINDKDDILVKVDNCVYEDNMGVLGWFGNKRMIMGSRDQMKHHDIKVPDQEKLTKYMGENTEAIYLSVAGEVVIIFFVELLANPEIKACLQKLTQKGVSLAVKSTDSIITVAKLAEVFEIPPEQIRVLPYSMHEQFASITKYVSRGSGALSCTGTFSGFARALLAAKALMKDINAGICAALAGAALGAICAVAAAFTGNSWLLSPMILMGWETAWLLLTVIVESFRRY